VGAGEGLKKKLSMRGRAAAAAAELHIPDLPTSLRGRRNRKRATGRLRTAWPEDKTYWKFAAKGASLDIFFQTTLNKAAEFTRLLPRGC